MPDRGDSVNGNRADNVLIWDGEGAISAGDSTTVFWRAFPAGTSCNSVSIPQLIEENADALRGRYLAWVYELGELSIEGRRLVDHLQVRADFSYWWMTLLVEKCNFEKSPNIDDAIRLLTFTDWVSGRAFDHITLASANQPLAECLRRWCKKSGVTFAWQRLPKPNVSMSWVRRAYAVLPAGLQAWVWLLKYLLERWPLRGVGLEEWRQTAGRVTFFSYLFNLVPEAARAGKHESCYWSHLPDELKRCGCKTNWLHLYAKSGLLPDAKNAAGIIRAFNATGRGMESHATLDTFLSVRVVLLALKDWVKLGWKGRQLQGLMCRAALKPPYLWPLFAEDWRQSTRGVAAIGNAVNRSLFEAAMNALPKQQLGCYLQENQGWESALIQTWKAANQGRLIGVPHSSVRFWDLRYFFDPRSYCRDDGNPLPLPDQVAVNGIAMTKAYIAGGYPVDDLVHVEALRYLYLEKAYARPMVERPYVVNNNLRLLVLGDYLASNSQLQMRLLAQAAPLLPPGMLVTVKPHPACPIRAEDYPELRLTTVMEPVANLLAECDVAYTSAVTSAAVDAYCAGVPVISVSDATTLNLSPLRGCEGVFFAHTPDELVRALRLIISAPHKSSTRRDFFSIDKKLPRWQELFIDAGSISTNVQ